MLIYLGAGLDLLNSSIVKLSSVGVEGVDAVGFLDTSGVPSGQAAGVDTLDPIKMGLDIAGVYILFESYDVLARNYFSLLLVRYRHGGDEG
jgi:hypothetical protein